MSQSASYYSITLSEFVQLKESANIFQYEEKKVVTLHQTHEGLKFILTKIVPSKTNSINDLFSPESYLGSLPDFEDDNADIDALLNNPPLYYLTPEKVNEINSVLTTVADTDISKHYSSKELNKKGVYPEVWNDSSDRDTAFNLNHLIRDFENLKDFFSEAALQNNYVIVSIG